MPWNESIQLINKSDPVLDTIINPVFQKIIENTKYNKASIDENKSTIDAALGTKVSTQTFSSTIDTLNIKNTQQDTEIAKKANSDTVSLLEAKVDNKLKVDSSNQQNFNFVSNKLVSSVYSGTNIPNKTSAGIKVANGSWDLTFIIDRKSNTVDSLCGNFFTMANGGFHVLLQVDNSIYFQYRNGISATQIPTLVILPYGRSNLRVTIENTTFSIYVDGVQKWTRTIDDYKANVVDTLFIGSYGSSGSSDSTNFSIVNLCNRLLSPQEINHNFSVLSTTPSIDTIEVTDQSNNKQSFLLSTDTDHTQDRSGRTQEAINRTFYKQFCKEFVSADGSDVTVSNGIDGYVLSGSMQGRTVKNYAHLNSCFTAPSQITATAKTKIPINGCAIINKYNKPINITFEDANGGWLWSRKVGADGVYILKDSDLGNKTGYIKQINGVVSDGWNISLDTSYFDERRCMFVDANTSKDSFGIIPFGLSSTVATISNNGVKSSFYLNASDKQNNIPIVLGGVGGVNDELVINEDGSASYTQRTKQITLTSTTQTLTDYKTGTPILASQSATISTNVATGVIGEAVRYQLATPITTQIPKELVPIILTGQTNILSCGDAVKASSFKASLPVDKMANFETRVARLESLHI